MISIIAAVIATFIFGMLWYGKLFGKYWMGLIGTTQEEMAANAKATGTMVPKMTLGFATGVVGAVVGYAVLHFLLMFLPSLSFGYFLKLMALLWFGFTFPIHAGLWSWYGKPFKLVLFNTAQGLLSLTILSAVLYYLA